MRNKVGSFPFYEFLFCVYYSFAFKLIALVILVVRTFDRMREGVSVIIVS